MNGKQCNSFYDHLMILNDLEDNGNDFITAKVEKLKLESD